MKSAKKIIFLVLALALLACLFAFGSTAAATTATIKYPDGSTQTVTVGESFTPKAFDATNKLYFGQNETVYKDDATEGWTFTYTVNKTAKTFTASDVIPSDAAGLTITAGGATKVLFTVSVDDVVTGYTTAAELNSYLAAMDYFARIKLYSDISISGPSGFYGKKTMDKNSSGSYIAMNTNYHLDINGFKLTFTKTGDAIFCRARNLYIYSSRPGGQFVAPNANNLVYTDNDDFKVIDGVVYGNSGTDKATYDKATDVTPNKPAGKVLFGELTDPGTGAGTYGGNLTVTCQALNKALYGESTGSVCIWGGTYVQTGTAAKFLAFTNRTVQFKNATFVINNATTVPVSATLTSRSFTNCTFVYNGDGSIPVTDHTSAVTFNNCKFVNMTPSYIAAHVYTNAKWGTDWYYPSEDLNASETVAAYIAHTSTTSTVTVNGVTYLLDGQIFDSNEGLKTVTWENGTVEYFSFAEGETFTTDGASFVKSTSGYIMQSAPYAKEVEGVFSYVPAPVPVVTETAEGYTVAIDPDEAAIPVTFTSTVGNVTTYYYNAENYPTDLRKALSDVGASGTKVANGTLVKLYQDVTISEKLSCQAVNSSAVVKLDLNGCTMNITTTATQAIFVQYGYYYFYSSKPNGEMNFTKATRAFYTDSNGGIVIGELTKPIDSATGKYIPGPYGENLTIRCNSFNESLFGSGMSVWGGTIIQNPTATEPLFLASQRGHETYTTFGKLANATVVMNAAKSVFNWCDIGDAKIENCTFIANVDGVSVATTSLASGKTPRHLPVFMNCDFVNIAPLASLRDGVVTYDVDCRFSLSELPTVEITFSEDLYYIAHVVPTENIVYGENSYPVNYQALPSSEVLTMEWGDGTVDYWALGTSPSRTAEVVDAVEKRGELYYRLYDGRYVASGITVVAAENLGTTAEVGVDYQSEQPVAFGYKTAADGKMLFVALDLSIAEEERAAYYGNVFYDTFHRTSLSSLVMYTDVVLTKAVEFGVFEYNKVYTKDAEGNPTTTEATASWSVKTNTHQDFSWDLNGCTVTYTADVIPLTAIEGDQEQTPKPKTNVLISHVKHKFILFSSVEGGELINESANPIFYGKKNSAPSILLGAPDPSAESTDNLHVVSNGVLIASYEPTAAGTLAYNGVSNYRLVVNGGTYEYKGVSVAFSIGQYNIFRNATLITSGAAKAVIAPHYYRDAFVTLDGCTVLSSSAGTYLFAKGALGAVTGSAMSTSRLHNHNVTNCIFVNAIVAKTYSTGEAKITLADNFVSDISYAFPEEGKNLVFTSVPFNGENVKLCGYFATEGMQIVTLNNTIKGTSELWVAGSAFVGDFAADTIYQRDGVYYCIPDATVSVKANGEDVSADPTDESLAGQEVIIALEGEEFALYFTIVENGETKLYYGDKAENEAALLAKLLALGKNGFELKLYSDMETKHGATLAMSGSSAKYYVFDLNGFDWHIEITKPVSPDRAMTLYNGIYVFYSTQPGANMSVTGTKSVFYVDNGGTVYFGERNVGSTKNGKNFTLECNALTRNEIWANGLYLIGGTYIQNSEQTLDYFINLAHGRLYGFDNVTIILNNASAVFNGALFDEKTTSCKNINIISKEKINLFIPGTVGDNAIFENSNFYNIVPNFGGKAGVAITFTNCSFNLVSNVLHKNGYAAYTGENVVKTINGVEYTFTAEVLAADAVALVDWGFGMSEYWKLGATAQHASAVVDSYFAYSFAPFTVAAGENKAVATLISIRPGALGMSLSLQSSIGINLKITELLEGVSAVKIGGITIETGEVIGNYVQYTGFIAPDVADEAVLIEITVGDNVHAVSVSVGTYAKTILGSEQHALAHNLTYAMAKYVEAMTGTDILDGMAAPAGYVEQTLSADSKENPQGLLKSISFSLKNTIAIGIAADLDDPEALAALEGKEVNLVLSTGRSEREKIENGLVVFKDLYVNEFYGEMTITLEGEGIEYKYSLAKYYTAMPEDEAAIVAALHNYTYYADQYVADISAQ